MSGPDEVAHVAMAVLGVVLLLIQVHIRHQNHTGAYLLAVLGIVLIERLWQLHWDLGHPLAQHTEYSLV